MSDVTTKTRCPGIGQAAIVEPATGFYGCPICKVPQGVIMRAGAYLTPEHNFGNIHREPGDQTFVLRSAEHANFPVCAMAAQHGLPKDIVIDLLLQGLMRMQIELQRRAEVAPPSQSKIIRTGN